MTIEQYRASKSKEHDDQIRIVELSFDRVNKLGVRPQSRLGYLGILDVLVTTAPKSGLSNASEALTYAQAELARQELCGLSEGEYAPGREQTKQNIIHLMHEGLIHLDVDRTLEVTSSGVSALLNQVAENTFARLTQTSE